MRLVLLPILGCLVAGCGVTPAPTTPASAAASSQPTAIPTVSAPAGLASPTPGAPGETPTPTASPAPAVLPGERWLAFQGDQGGGKYGIRLVRLDGTGMHALAPDVPGQYQLHPDWSPDGKRLVFSEVGSSTTDLWTIDADGQNAKHIVDCTARCTLADEGSWSPDGSTIAFHRQALVDGGFVSTLELYDVAAGTTHIVIKAADDRVFYGPRWAPDGHRLVVENAHRPSGGTGDDIDASQVAIVDVSAKNPKAVPITGPEYWPGNPEWSPVGDTIVFFRPDAGGDLDGPTDLWTIRPDGTRSTRLTHLVADGGKAIEPAWAFDGSRIVFTGSSATLGEGSIATIAADGSDLHPVTTGGDIHGQHPRLRPTP
jgi:TolB protein